MGADYVEVTLDKPRTLRYDIGAMRRLNDEHGINLLESEGFSFSDLDLMPKLLWGGLIHEDPELTLEAVEAMITMPRMADIMEALAKAMAGDLAQAVDPTAGSESQPTASE